jgi:hypothetical protein
MNKLSLDTELILDVSDPLIDYQKHFCFYTEGQEPLFENPIVITPLQKHPRLLAQCSLFTVHGTNLKPLEDIYDGDILKKIEIPSSLIPAAKRFLKLTNMNEYSLFPDLDGLCRKIMREDGYFEGSLKELNKT